MNKKLISFITMTSILLTSVSPAFAKSFSSKSNISLDHTWTVTVSKPLASNQDYSKIKIINNSTGASIPIACKVTGSSNTTLSIVPQQNYSPNSGYTLTVDGLKDVTGEDLKENATLSFSTVNTDKFQLQSFDNVFDTSSVTETNVDTNKTLTCVFTKPLDSSTLSSIYVTDSNGNKTNVKPQLSQSGTTLILLPNNDFWDDTHTVSVPRDAYSCNTTYTVHFDDLKSTDGEVLSNVTAKFKTVDYPTAINPTLDDIQYGNTDYLANVNNYISDTIHPVASGRQVTSLEPQHEDSNGNVIFENDGWGTPEQLYSSTWNKYANAQAKNLFNLQVALRKQNSMLANTDANYASISPGYNQIDSIPTQGSQGYTYYQYRPLISDDMGTEFYVYVNYAENTNVADNAAQGNTSVANAINTLKPQIILITSSYDTSVKGNSSKLALYQSIYALVGKQYAKDVYDFILRHPNDTETIGNITVQQIDNEFLIKYN